jgi:hypothetical protein
MRSFAARRITLALTALTLSAGTAAAQTQVLGFEDVGSDYGCCLTLPTGYGGFNWGLGYNTMGKAAYPGTGYATGTTGSRSIFLYNFGNSAITSSTLFDFVGADFAAAWNASQTVTLMGYRGGVMVGSTSATITNTAATFVTANFMGIDELRISGTGSQINIDQFTTGEIGIDATTTAPEPASIALMGTGLLAIGGLAARRKRV